MARTFAEAIAAVEGPEFDLAVGYVVPRPVPRPVGQGSAATFADLDYTHVRRIQRMLASRYHCHLADAEEAVHDVLVQLMATKVDLYRRSPDHWMGLLYRLSRFRLLDAKFVGASVSSIDELVERAGDSALQGARPCEPASREAEEEAGLTSPPCPGEEWNRSQVIGALQRFRDRSGRPPRSDECGVLNGLPSTSVIRRHFGALANALVASGMVPDGPLRRRQRWIPREAARVCRSFRWRHGYWPSWADVRRRPGELPSTTAMVRCFGGTRSIDVQLGAEAILAASDE